MRKAEFLRALKSELSDVVRSERDRALAYYSELIDDKIEAGISEEEAVAGLGTVKEVAAQIIADARERDLLKKKRSPIVIALLVLGSPLWVPLLIALASVMFAFVSVLFALLVSCFAILFALAAVFIGSFVAFVFNIANAPLAVFILGVGLICGAMSLALAVPVICLVKAAAIRIFEWLKKIFVKIANKVGEIA